MNWVFFALLAPFFWAVSNFFDKYAVTKLTHGVYDFVFFGSIGNFLLLIGLLLVHGIIPVPLHVALVGIAAGLFLNYAYILYGKALSAKDTSEIIPLFQLIPVFVLIFGYLFLSQSITPVQFVGFFLVLFGVGILSVHRLPGARTTLKPEFWLMLASSFSIAISFICMDYLLENTSLLNAMVYDITGFTFAALSLFLFSTSRKEVLLGIRTAKLRKYLLFFGNDGADMLGHLAVRAALIFAPAAGLVSVVGSIQPLYVLGMGYLMTKWKPDIIEEDIAHTTVVHRFLSIIAIVAGIILVSL